MSSAARSVVHYLLLLPQYEFVAVTVFPIAGLLTAWGLVTRMQGGDYFLEDRSGGVSTARLLPLLGGGDAGGVLSWAGEKMPWLEACISPCR
ncbi:MAG: hypothetical protein R3A46_06690 [Thermomicrobiales bacterium]